MDGIAVSVIGLALFGIPSALDLALARMGVEKESAPLTGSLLDGVKDCLKEWWLVVRCSVLGVWVGIVPGIGAQQIDWLAYGHAAQTCKGAKDTFGKGDVRGVIAPESANDAKDGGDLMSVLFVGMPQGVTTALFIAALLALGILPGPDMVSKHLDMIFSIVWIMGIAGVVGTLIGFTVCNPLAKLAQVRYGIMVPLLFTFILMGALSADRDALDLALVVLVGVAGYFMKRLGYPRPPLLLGVVMAPLLEKYLFISVASYGARWLLFPSVIILFVITIGSLAYTLWGFRKKDSGSAISGADTTSLRRRESPPFRLNPPQSSLSFSWRFLWRPLSMGGIGRLPPSSCRFTSWGSRGFCCHSSSCSKIPLRIRRRQRVRRWKKFLRPSSRARWK
jgi:TctA family transporter